MLPTNIRINETPVNTTLALIGYNQESMIRRAIDGALAQSGPPIEIIFSDDHSADGTFDVMQTAAEAYRGPHRIVLNRNSRNLGIGGHVARVSELATGQWVALAAGDDVSLPQRCARIDELSASHPNAKAIVFKGTEQINRDTVSVKDVSSFELIRNYLFCGDGAYIAYHKDCFVWPELYPSDVWFEDRVLPFRASILGDVLVSNEHLIQYTRDKGSWRERVLPSEQLLLIIACARQAVSKGKEQSRLPATEVRKIESKLAQLAKLYQYYSLTTLSENRLSRYSYEWLSRWADFRLIGVNRKIQKIYRRLTRVPPAQ